MNILIRPSVLKGVISAPASKSYTHRALILSALATGNSVISRFLQSEDTVATLSALKKLGIKVEIKNSRVHVKGSGGHIRLPANQLQIDLNNSGTSLRLLMGLCCLTDGRTVLTGSRKLLKRPVDELVGSLQKLGITVTVRSKKNEFPGVEVYGGKLTGGEIIIDCARSSQFLSALLLIAPFAQKDLIIRPLNLSSAPYADITLDLMKKFGAEISGNINALRVDSRKKYHSLNYTVEGDYSSAAYFFAANAIGGSEIKINNLNPRSRQGDKIFLRVLNQMKNGNKLRGIEIDMNKYPDLVPVLAVTAAFAGGKTLIKNISHLRSKESDRIQATASQLVKMGIDVKQKDSSLLIFGGRPKGAEIETFDDHRLAMSFAVAALNARGVTVIKNAQTVNKSYPDFWRDLKKTGADYEVI